jgi:hypothetical protein
MHDSVHIIQLYCVFKLLGYIQAFALLLEYTSSEEWLRLFPCYSKDLMKIHIFLCTSDLTFNTSMSMV